MSIALRKSQETRANLITEDWAKARLEVMWKVQLEKTPRHYRCDWEIMRGKDSLGLAEFKSSSHTYDQQMEWGGFRISYKKFDFAYPLVALTDLPYYLIVKFSGEKDLYQHKFDRQIYNARQRGENPYKLSRFEHSIRGREADKEPCIVLEEHHFEKVKKDEFENLEIKA